MGHKLIGSHTVEESAKIFAERAKARDAKTAERRARNLVSRDTLPSAPDTATNRGLPQPKPKAKVKKPKKKKVIKIDPNVKPIGRSVLPVAAVVDSLKSAFAKFTSGAKAGASKAKEGVKTAGAKIKQAAVASSEAATDKKTVVPLTAKPTLNPFKKNTRENARVVPLKGFEKLAEEQGVPQSQSFNKARGVKTGDRGPLLNALAKRKAAQARKANLGGDRSTAGRSRTRARPSLKSASPTPAQREALAKIPTQAQVTKKEKSAKTRQRVISGIVGGAIGVAAARRFR